MTQDSRLQQVLDAIDAENRQDPHQEQADGQSWPKEYLYSLRMSEQLARFAPNASELLQIAARAQHIRRWTVPRTDYPMDRAGYKHWRTDLAKYHGELTAKLMENAGYNEMEQERVKALLLKKQLKRDDEVQTLEDVICLVFIHYYLEDFATKHEEEKLLDIIRKTWGKMSEAGHAAALQVPLSPPVQSLVGKALAA
ncbi:hypothetical protein AN401_14645 [Zobellella denitrificans]|uniref:DUF4202 domain-containing protein n=1 Tax=Zobellella denitrificans TaxID=347534 RepID=A0A291HRU0_9GAMM|nr:DUF4202 domain-containing protein [Zobellella denitrificans]ATG74946.1 hypothetical protein AN401_14645 [Zobellella denitrificans]